MFHEAKLFPNLSCQHLVINFHNHLSIFPLWACSCGQILVRFGRTKATWSVVKKVKNLRCCTPMKEVHTNMYVFLSQCLVLAIWPRGKLKICMPAEKQEQLADRIIRQIYFRSWYQIYLFWDYENKQNGLKILSWLVSWSPGTESTFKYQIT